MLRSVPITTRKHQPYWILAFSVQRAKLLVLKTIHYSL